MKSLTRIETPVPNTTVTINTFDVVYSVVVEHENSSSGSSSVGEEKELERKESGIKSDRFRIVADSKGNAIVDGVVVPKVVQETGGHTCNTTQNCHNLSNTDALSCCL